MTAFNVVRFRVKPGCEQAFVDAHRNMRPDFKGFRNAALVKTGDRTYCMVGEWTSFQKIVDARPTMIGLLDGMREFLEDLGGGLGLTDPVSGEVMVAVKALVSKRKRTTKSAKQKGKATAKRKRSSKKAK